MTDRRMRVARSGSSDPSGPSAQVAYHPELGNGGRVGKRLALTSAAESALVVQRDGRTVGGRDPETKANRSAFSCPGDHRVDQGGADTAPAR